MTEILKPGLPEEEFTEEQLAAVDRIMLRYEDRPGSLIPVLEEIQETLGHIPKPIQEKVAARLGLPLSEVYGVVTFYHFFSMFPRGKHTCRVCMGTACYVRGGQNGLNKIMDHLNIKPGETTDDRMFSLETVRCLGACGLAPTMVIDEETFPRVKPAIVAEIFRRYRQVEEESATDPV
ncbi:MAG: NAD(P)H-dependent oxidoreductase subunit E [Proteobacteria bacterium]|nr:NAD(P)H-dependent oxidoreductase subunit E [Pseudomonadota bacterium]